jgi:ubiquinone biosynthesis protein UbiJ
VLGPKHRALFDRIRSEALSPTGKLRVDGATITTTELVKLIDRFRSDPAAVTNVDIE